MISKIAFTETLCPICLKKLPGEIVEVDGRIELKRQCPEHGLISLLISKYPNHYKQLKDYYLSVIKPDFKQSRYLMFITEKCNMQCPICFYGTSLVKELSVEEIKEILENKLPQEVVLFGREPTCHEQLPEIIRLLHEHQHTVSVYTNGIMINDLTYLQCLKQSGADKIYLQFDGFIEETYEKFRGEKLFAKKMKSLELLKQEKLDTVLDITISKKYGQEQIKEVFEYALKHPFIKTLNMIAYIRSGRGRFCCEEDSLMPDELIDFIEQATQNTITRNAIFLFQKLLYAYMSFLKLRTCSYIQYFWVYRDVQGKYLPIDKILNLQRAEKILDIYKKLFEKNSFCARLFLICVLPFFVFRLSSIKVLFEFLRVVFAHMFKFGEYSGKSTRFLQLIFTTACDPYKADFNIAQQCHVGIVYKDKNDNVQIMDENGLYLLNTEMALHSAKKKEEV